MTTFTNQLLSRKTSTPEVWQCECEYSSRSATVSALCSLCRSHFHSTRRQVRQHVTWCLTKPSYSSYPTSRWDVAVNLMVTVAGRCSLSHRQKHRNLQRENLQFTLCTELPGFEHDYLPAIWGVIQQTVYHHPGFSSVDKIKRAIVKSMAETTAVCSHCQFITFITFLFTVNVIRQMAPLFSKVGMMSRMKRTWFVPNLVKICSIFLKL